MEEWEVEFTDEFGAWWEGLSEAEQVDVRAEVNLLRRFGPMLGRPHVDSVASSKHANMKELRVQHRGRPYRVLFAFDPRRTAILLIGGNKTGKGRWYKEFVPIADRLYDEHLETLRREGLLDGEEFSRTGSEDVTEGPCALRGQNPENDRGNGAQRASSGNGNNPRALGKGVAH